MKIHKKTKLNKTNITNISSNNKSLTSTKLVSRKILNKLILKGGNYVRNYNVSSDHNKKTQKQNGDLKRTLTALKQKKYFTKSQKQDGGFIIDSIKLKLKLMKFKSFLKKYRKEEKEIQKYIDSYKGKTTILESLKDKKFNKAREYIIHYRKLKIFEFLKNNKDNEKDVKTLDIDGNYADASSKLKGIDNSLKQFEKEQKRETPNLNKQTKTFAKNSKAISNLIAYFEKTLRKYYEEIDMIRANYKEFQGKSKLDSEAKSKIKKYQRFARDIDFILSFNDMEQKKMIDLKNDISTIIDKGQTFSKQFKDFDSSTFGEDLEKWKENYTRIYENLDITDDIDDIVETYKETINNLEVIRNQLVIMKMSKGGFEADIENIRVHINNLNKHMNNILLEQKKYIRQLKMALLLDKPFKDVDVAVTIIIGSIKSIIEYNKKLQEEFNKFNKSIGNSGVSTVGGGVVSIGGGVGCGEGGCISVGGSKSAITTSSGHKFFSYEIKYTGFFGLTIKGLEDRFKDNKYKLDEIEKVKIKYDKNNDAISFLEATIEQQYNTLRDLFNIWLYLTYWSEGTQTYNKNDKVVDIFTTDDKNKTILMKFIRLIFVYELLCYNDTIKKDKVDKYDKLKDILEKLFENFNPFSEANNIIKQMDSDKNIPLAQLKSGNNYVDDWINKLNTNTTKMNDYQISDIKLSTTTPPPPQLKLKTELGNNFIVAYMDNEETKKNFNEEYKNQIDASGNIQSEINEWKTPDNNAFKKAVALSILHLRLNDKPSPDQVKNINQYIKDIDNDTTTIKLEKICDEPSGIPPVDTTGTGIGIGTGAQGTANPGGPPSGPGTANPGGPSSGPGTANPGALSSPTPTPTPQPTPTITTGIVKINTNLVNDPVVAKNVDTIVETVSELETTMDKLTPQSDDDNTIPEAYDKIIKKLTIINECVSNLKLIEPKFNIENAKYEKVNLGYDWVQNYFKKEGEFGATSGIQTIKDASSQTKFTSSTDKSKEKFTEDEFNYLMRNMSSQSSDSKVNSIIKKLENNDNFKLFKDLFEKSSASQKCSDAKNLDKIVNIGSIRTYLQAQSIIHCKKDNKKTTS